MTRELHSITDSIYVKEQCSTRTMFQQVHDYNASPIHEAVQILRYTTLLHTFYNS